MSKQAYSTLHALRRQTSAEQGRNFLCVDEYAEGFWPPSYFTLCNTLLDDGRNCGVEMYWGGRDSGELSSRIDKQKGREREGVCVCKGKR